MIEFKKSIDFDQLGKENPVQRLIIETDDHVLIKAITETVCRFTIARKIIEEATIPADEAKKLITQELNLFAENAENNKVKSSRNVARRHVEAVFEGLSQTVPFKTLGELYKYMTGSNTARSGCPETHIRMLNKKRLPNRPKIVNIIRMDIKGHEYTTSRKAN